MRAAYAWDYSPNSLCRHPETFISRAHGQLGPMIASSASMPPCIMCVNCEAVRHPLWPSLSSIHCSVSKDSYKQGSDRNFLLHYNQSFQAASCDARTASPCCMRTIITSLTGPSFLSVRRSDIPPSSLEVGTGAEGGEPEYVHGHC